MVGAGGVWFTLISDLLEDAAFLYFGASLVMSTRKSE
jgi:hypothetical protein